MTYAPDLKRGLRFHLVRLAIYCVPIVCTYLLTRWHDPRPWVALVFAGMPAVVFAPAAMLSYEGIMRCMGWGRFRVDRPRVGK